ncbi:MAG: hypothetical protein ACYTAS_24365 [Planctomycetota bacterium]|jgi:hypothetical protein
MELSWVNKARIGAVAALGIIMIGVLAWPLAAPQDPLAPVRSSHVGLSGTVVLLALAFAIGFVAYFLAWPHGREIGILAVPFGLAIWVVRSGPMRTLTQTHPTPAGREAILQSLRFEPVYWFLIVAAGFLGVLAAQFIRPGSGPRPTASAIKDYFRPNLAVAAVAALVVAVLLAHFALGVFAQDLSTSAGAASTQPVVGQIVFAGVATFAAAAFAVKKLFDLSYIWPAVASLFVIPFASASYGRADVVRKFAETQPGTFFPHAVFTILPLQLVALGAIGSVLGYWLAVRYDYWRKHEMGS